MTSILTNTSAIAALQTLRSIGGQLEDTQSYVSSGLRVQRAADDAAYWSISTTMRSDNMAVSAVMDALGLGAAQVDVAYAAMDAVADVLADFKAKLVTAKEDSVDKTKIQAELNQLKDMVAGIATTASFNGVNWLKTDIADINDSELNRTSLTSSFNRTKDGVSVGTTDLHLSKVSLFNENGGGILQADTRKLKTLGGVRISDTYMDAIGIVHTFPVNDRDGLNGRFQFDFTGPITFGVGDTLSFDVTVDVDNPAHVDPPHDPGKTTHISIDRAFVDTWLPGQNGVIQNYTQYATILQRALSTANSGATALLVADGFGGTVPNKISVSTRENSGLDGSSIQITNLVGTAAGLTDTAIHYGTRASAMTLNFVPFEVYPDGDNVDGVQVDFNFSVNGMAATHHSFDRTYVNNLLGKDTGKIETAGEMVTLLQSLIGNDWPDVIIENVAGNVSLRSDKDVDRLAGMHTYMGFTGISVSIEPLAEQNFLDIDIVENPTWIDRYIGYIELVSGDVIDAAATLGALKTRVDLQASFAQTLMDSIEKGIGRLVDADMNEASTRLKALQTQQQLGIQSLQIANTSAESIMALFR